MTHFDQFLNQLPESFQTDDVHQWLTTAEQKEQETIPNGLILEFSDVVEHPFDNDIWLRFINSLTFLLRQKTYYKNILSNINLIQQLNIQFTNQIEAPMAVSLMSIQDMTTDVPKIDFKKKPYLYINPDMIWYMMIDIYNGSFDTKTQDKMFDTFIGLLVHETYHIVRGDLLTEAKYHYTSQNTNERYKNAIQSEPFELDIDGHTREIDDIHQLRNILMDASINADIIQNISKDFFPEKLQRQSITPLSTKKSFKDVVDFSHSNHDKHFKRVFDFNINSEQDFFDDNINIKDKQYAILEMLDAKSDDNSNSNSDDSNNDSNDDESNDGESNDGNSDSGLSESEIQGKHSDALSNQSEQDIDNLASNLNNLMNVANTEAQAESNGKANQMEAQGELRERVIRIQKAKALPKLDRKVESLIQDFNREKRLNWNRRHIAYANRLDMAHHEKLIKAKGFYAYLDVSGSISEELLSNLFNILYETSKQEPCYLYVFATTFATKSFEIKKNTTVQDILDYISEEQVGDLTDFEPVFKHIVDTKKYKHAIFSDYMFDLNDYLKYKDELVTIPIIHVVENILFLEQQLPMLYKDLLRYKQYHKMIQQSDYIQKEKEVL